MSETMNRWYFPFTVGIIVFLVLSIIGKQDLTYILLWSGGITLGFFLMYVVSRRARKKSS
jgi:positive regulator of sigma E activity